MDNSFETKKQALIADIRRDPALRRRVTDIIMNKPKGMKDGVAFRGVKLTDDEAWKACGYISTGPRAIWELNQDLAKSLAAMENAIMQRGKKLKQPSSAHVDGEPSTI